MEPCGPQTLPLRLTTRRETAGLRQLLVLVLVLSTAPTLLVLVLVLVLVLMLVLSTAPTLLVLQPFIKESHKYRVFFLLVPPKIFK